MTESRALITGASSGLGAEFARQLAGRGEDLILVSRRIERLAALASELSADYGVQADVIQADLSRGSAVPDLYDEVERRGYAVDWLINNAGAAGPDLLNDRDWSAQQRYIELMMTSVAGMCHHFVPPMRQRGFGRVVNVASVAGLFTVSGDSSYGPTKAYLIALSKGLAATLRGSDINVLALCPGFTHTEFHQSDKLAKMKRSSPDWFWYDADIVVREGLAALEKGRDVYVSGRLYRFLVPLLRSRIGDALLARLRVKRDY